MLEGALFRGATKPVMFVGVPINALVAVVLPCIIGMTVSWSFLGLWAIVCLLPAVLGVLIMRQVTKIDDQYLLMLLLDKKEQITWCMRNRHDGVVVVPPRALRDVRFMED